MKILHATEALGGGVQSAIGRFAELHNEGEHFLAGRPRLGTDNRPAAVFSATRIYAGGALGFTSWVRVQAREVGADVVHLHSSFAGLARLVLPRSTPIVYSPHCYAFERLDLRSPVRAAIRTAEALMAQRPHVVAAVSPYEQALALSLRRSSETVMIPNAAISTPHNRKTVAGRIVMVGRICAQKDPGLFAAVAQNVGPHAEFVWVGGGEPDLEDQLRAAGVRVTGWLSPDDVNEVVATADLYLHTGRWESAPMATIDAAASGVPVLSRDVASMRSLGYAIAGSTSSAISASVRKFLSDELYRHEVEQLSQQVAAANSADLARDVLRAVYARAIELVAR